MPLSQNVIDAAVILAATSPLWKSLFDGAKAYFDLRKTKADTQLAGGETAEKISAAWERLNKPLIERIEMLEKESREKDERIDALEKENEKLVFMITERDRQIVEMQKEITRLQSRRGKKRGMLDA